MKTAISIPDRLFQSAEELAGQLGISRSEFFSKAVASLIEEHRDDLITARLNEVYADGGTNHEPISLDQETALPQHRSLIKRKR